MITKGVQFRERMSGWIKLSASDFPEVQIGVRYPFEFVICAHSTRILSFTHPRKIKGTARFISFPHPFGDADVEGTLTTSISGVKYDFDLRFKSKSFRVIGRKQYAWHRVGRSGFFDSLTVLPLTVFCDERVVGEAMVVYRDPLWHFPLTLRIVGARVSEADIFVDRASLARMLFGLIPLFVPWKNRITGDDDGIFNRILLQVQSAPRSIAVVLRLCGTVISFLSKIDQRSDREKVLRWIAQSPLLRKFSMPVSTVVLSAVYSDASYLSSKGHFFPKTTQETEPARWKALHFKPNGSFPSEIEVDVVIVGSGAGGAAAAYSLASQGHAVAVLESGAYFDRSDFTGERLEMMKKLYQDSGYSFPISNVPVWMPTGKCVGGTTTINCGTSIRTPLTVQKRWSRELELPDLELGPYFDEVEAMLNVQPVDADLLGPISSVLQKGLRGTTYQAQTLFRGEAGCDGQGCCILGCPTGAKRSTNVSFLPEAMARNTHLYTHCTAIDFVFKENSNGKSIQGIRAHLEGYGPEFSVTFRAKKTILAMGALKTPQFLHARGIHRQLKHVGRNLTLHPAINVGATVDSVSRGRPYVPQSVGVFGIDGADFILEGHTLSIDSIPISLAVFGRALEELMENSDNFTNFAAMLSDSARGRMHFFGGKGLASYSFDSKTLRTLQDAAVLLAEIFFSAGAKNVYAPIRGFEKMSDSKDVSRLRRARLRSWDFGPLSAHHPLGTCRMAGSSTIGVVSPHGKVWGHENLYIVDGSTIPGPLGVNPQVTIMANALRVARHIGQEL